MKRYPCGNTEPVFCVRPPQHCAPVCPPPCPPQPWEPGPQSCSPVPFVQGETYCAGQVVSWQGILYRARVTRPVGTPGQSPDFIPAGDCCWGGPIAPVPPVGPPIPDGGLIGPTGPTGPAGMPGPQGPTGPAGPTGATEGKKDAQPWGKKGEKG